jgi:hypothetical protein
MAMIFPAYGALLDFFGLGDVGLLSCYDVPQEIATFCVVMAQEISGGYFPQCLGHSL